MNHFIRYLWMPLCLSLVSCSTVVDKARQKVSPGQPLGPFVEFQPDTYLAPLHHDKGTYADLFGPESFAVWIAPEVTALKRAKALEIGETLDPRLEADAGIINRDYLLFECHVESAFADTSIAYDVVGFRGMDVHLETPDGRVVRPVRVSIGTPVHEEPRNTLRLFRRTNLVVFAKRDLWVGHVAPSAGSPCVRLVLEGHSTRFSFPWPEMASRDTPPSARTQEEALRLVQYGFKEVYGRTRELLHIFD